MDTGAEVTVISEHQWKSLGMSEVKLASKMLHGPDNKPLDVWGELHATLSYRGRQCAQPVFIVKHLQLNLPCLPAILALNKLAQVQAVSTPISEQYPALFTGLGTSRGIAMRSNLSLVPSPVHSLHHEVCLYPCGRISNAPEQFQWRMSEILQGQEGILCHTDDILIFGQNQQKHDSRLHSAQCVQAAGLMMNPDKCEFKKPCLDHIPGPYHWCTWGISGSQQDLSGLGDGNAQVNNRIAQIHGHGQPAWQVHPQKCRNLPAPV